MEMPSEGKKEQIRGIVLEEVPVEIWDSARKYHRSSGDRGTGGVEGGRNVGKGEVRSRSLRYVEVSQTRGS